MAASSSSSSSSAAAEEAAAAAETAAAAAATASGGSAATTSTTTSASSGSAATPTTTTPTTPLTNRREGLGRGLVNPPGMNICYLNSLVQALNSFDIFVEPLLAKPAAGGVRGELKRLVSQLRHSDILQPESTNTLREMLHQKYGEFSMGRQCDAEEALTQILQELDDLPENIFNFIT